jgi:FKBP-type peptidyl-prolyl cis-trans isomerase
VTLSTFHRSSIGLLVLSAVVPGFPRAALARAAGQAGMAAQVETPPPDVAAPPPDALKTRSGLAFKVLRPGTGTVHPKSSSTVTVHDTGWTADGKMFDSSVVKGPPATFSPNGVIQGWTEGLQLMVAGESRRFWIPGELAYDGENRSDGPRGTLVFDIELIAIDGK